MSKNHTPKHSPETPPDKGDVAVLDRHNEHQQDRTPIEPREWRGEGVVGDLHTD